MTTHEPPSGADDLAAQAEALAKERAAYDAEVAEMMRARQQRVIDAGRAELDRERAELAKERSEIDSPTVVPAGSPLAVIDPDGEEYDIGPDGEVYRDDDGNPVPKWPHAVIPFKGIDVQVRAARPEALQAFGLATSKYAPEKVRSEMWALFVSNHISPRSYAELVKLMMDPDTEFTIADFSELTKQIATMNTARPTGPSQR
jgi:hypothetical protein